ncbi:unnamed protein product, partial [Symbiodinium pilosum]
MHVGSCRSGWLCSGCLTSRREMHQRQIAANVITHNAAIAACAAAGRWVHAVAILYSMASPDIVSFNSAIAACEVSARWQTAACLLQDMKVKHLVPDALSYNAAQAALKTSWQWRQSLDLLADMKELRASTPDLITYSAVVSVCAKGDAAREVVTLLQEVCKLVSGDWPWQMCSQCARPWD